MHDLLNARCYREYRQTVKYVVLTYWSRILSILKTDGSSIDGGRYATLQMEFQRRIKRFFVRPTTVFPLKYTKVLYKETLRVDTHTQFNVVFQIIIFSNNSNIFKFFPSFFA